MKFSANNRSSSAYHAQHKYYDLTVIGGGITGAGIALDASLRGLSVLLIEKNDFASGTSSKSTKLIHGGLRYLKQFEFSLVREVGLERAILHNLLPHLVVPEKMLLPIVQNGSLGSRTCAIALSVYDYLASVEKKDKKEMLNPEDVLKYEPMLQEAKDLIGGAIYAEYRTDDARLTIELIKEAYSNNATCLNHMEVTACKKNEQGYSIESKDSCSGQTFRFNSSSVVNAAGPWTDRIINKQGQSNSKKIFLSKGVHLVIDRSKLNLKQSLYFDIGDGRMMFAIPRQGKVYFGTTDTEFHGNLNQIEISIEDCSYLIGAVNRRFPQANIGLEDIESCWAGLRPLIRKSEKSTTEMSRKDEVFIAPSGIISIAGGKLTGFRKMAERVVNIVEQRLFGKKTPCLTAYHSFKSKSFTSPSVSTYHNFTYGTAAESILGQLDPGSEDALIQEYIYCIDEECCINPLDYFLRRSGKMYFNISAVEQELELCLKTFKNYLNWTDKQTEQARKNVLESIERHRLTKIKKASIN